MTLKKYSFEIRTLKALDDSFSPHTLVKFDFLSTDDKQAEKYKTSLIEHYSLNKPNNINIPRENTPLKSETF